MTEIGNRIYLLGRDQRLNMCMCMCESLRAVRGCICRSVPCRRGGLTTGIIDERQSPFRLQAVRRPLGFGVLWCLHVLTALQATDSSAQSKQMRNRLSWKSTSNFSQPSNFSVSPVLVGAACFTQCSCPWQFFRFTTSQICAIIDYGCIVWSWLTASGIYAYAWVCIWIPLFLMRQTHTCI